MSGVEENKSANAATNDHPGESPPDNPSNAEGSGVPAPDNPPNPDGPGEPTPDNPLNFDGGEPAPGNPPNPNGSGESPPDNPPNNDGSSSGSSFEVIPDPEINNANARIVTTRSSAPGRLETCRFKKKPMFMAGIEVGEDGFPVGPYICLAERMRLEELNNPPERPRTLSSSEDEIIHPPTPSPEEDPNRICEFPGDTP